MAVKLKRENQIIYILSIALCVLLTALVFTLAFLMSLKKENNDYKRDLATLIYITRPMIENNVTRLEQESEVEHIDSENFTLLPIE